MRQTWITLIAILICAPLVAGCGGNTGGGKETPSVQKEPTKANPRGVRSPPAPEAPP